MLSRTEKKSFGDLVESDGVSSNGSHLPWAPRNVNQFVTRLETFSSFPASVPVDKLALAKTGFYYTRLSDKVTCFSCGNSVNNWEANDDPHDSCWHKRDCQYFLENQLRNSAGGSPRLPHNAHDLLLRSLNLRVESERRKTFESWPPFQNVTPAQELAKDGLFFTGSSLKTQCFSCFQVFENWANQIGTVNAKHRAQSGNCRMALGNDDSNIPIPSPNLPPTTSCSSTPQRMLGEFCYEAHGAAGTFPGRCVYGPIIGAQTQPKEIGSRPRSGTTPLPALTTAMQSYEKRHQTFASGWPSCIGASTEMLATAGFFYLGENGGGESSDSVRCFYCNGGLKDWKYDDDPWVEHAKWFPACEFLLEKKGHSFVQSVLERFPALVRPSDSPRMSNQSPQQLALPGDTSGASSSRNGQAQNQDGASPPRQSTTALQLTDLPNMEKESVCILHAENVIADNIELVLKDKALEELRKALENQDGRKLCKVCQRTLIEVAFVPCGHFVCCSDCGRARRVCFFCNGRVESLLKVKQG